MKLRFVASFAALFIYVGVSAASQTPIAISGFTQDFVVDASESYPGGVTGTMDDGAGANTGNTWYGQGFNGGAPTTGFPTGVYTSESDLQHHAATGRFYLVQYGAHRF